MRPRGPEGTVHSISALPTSLRDDQSDRIRHYVISMGIRTACFVLAGMFAVVFRWTPGVWLCLIAAVVLPYPAVVLANNASNKKSHFIEPVTPVREIGTAEDQQRGPGPGESW
ncbi:MAG: DUF3099 domain-containing protein [Austwickia sp.]|nr:DUF3099 domain-containing protein [Austwickia sp.]MBK8435374.1 DUF3099 domain-containing protein [Austwickia sp.]MBK9101079.1 DUF3099 domain-containing protein [Austwickia sp.]